MFKSNHSDGGFFWGRVVLKIAFSLNYCMRMLSGMDLITPCFLLLDTLNGCEEFTYLSLLFFSYQKGLCSTGVGFELGETLRFGGFWF